MRRRTTIMRTRAPAPMPVPVDVVVAQSTPTIQFVDFLQSILHAIRAGRGEIPDSVRLDIRLWIQHNPHHDFIGRLETLSTAEEWINAIEFTLHIDDTTPDGPLSPRDRFLAFLRQRSVAAATSSIMSVCTIENLRDAIFRSTILPQDARPMLSPASVRSHLETLSFNDLYLLHDIKSLPSDAPISALEKGFHALVKKTGVEWEDHFLSRLFQEANGDAVIIQEYIRNSCFYPSPAIELFVILRMTQWRPVRLALASHGDEPDRLPTTFWIDHLSEEYRDRFPKRLWRMDRVSQWKQFFAKLDKSPAFDDATLIHMIDMINPPGTLARMGGGRTSEKPKSPPEAVAPRPKWLELSNQMMPMMTRITLMRTQPWLESYSVADLVIQSMETPDSPILINCPFYSTTSFRLPNDETVWLPNSDFYIAMFENQDDPAPRASYHPESGTFSIPHHKHHFRIYLSLVSGQFVVMTKEFFNLQKTWFRNAVASNMNNMKQVSLQNMSERPLCSFEEGWVQSVRDKEVSILIQILLTSGVFRVNISWDFEKLASSLEKACMGSSGLSSLRLYWERIFLIHSVFSDHSVFRECRSILIDRIRYGMFSLASLPNAPLRLVFPELWAFTAEEADQIEKIYRDRMERFVRDRLIEHVGYFFPRSITERKATTGSTFSLYEQPIHLPYPSGALDTVCDRLNVSNHRLVVWDEKGDAFSLLQPESWNADIRQCVDRFFDEETFDMASPETAIYVSSCMEFMTALPETGAAAGIITPPHASTVSATRLPPQWTLPDFETNMIQAIYATTG